VELRAATAVLVIDIDMQRGLVDEAVDIAPAS